MLNKKGKIFVLSGPSGCGKNTVFEGIQQFNKNVAQTVSVTTRAPRTNEKNGIDYYFVEKEEFLRKIENNEFIEYALYGENYYGTLKSEVDRLVDNGNIVILVIEVQGAANIKKVMPESKSIFLLPPSLDELGKRLRSREQNTEAEINMRMNIALEEIKFKDSYDFCVLNDDLDKCIQDVNDIITK
ncbi:MAG: guanylate kinase [Clostridia bacterium]|nr:guanylate kinase [Clostridia bacterium]